MANSVEFDKLPPVDDLAGLLDDVFGVKLNVSGGWGYDNNTALEVGELEVPVDQFIHMFASMRANVEMNLTLEEEDRFGAINVNLKEAKQFDIEGKSYDIFTFDITAMPEKVYADFIQEYKDNYGKNKDFDMDDHFKRREQSTVHIESDFWFEGLPQK
ncbi:MAG: hypothetical protein U9Q33_12980 [Campylobacterota bacterium]|nr:hypothetical protein [Campylobacterota bacterium]